ncbi:hypothetical protein IAG44_39235 [Streptomyces roseirectus]|uniref:Uncharacterized protein n=1 Tax=Streptomyces roseirectus TaxID=2768066 RepID=A0A7H0IQ07_9ACTN|nr:hypothetical protein [Streptomyces roseirectus]QNP74873.1 hypothetical protein IAG44_39235 [Streptomyces roseirectus]
MVVRRVASVLAIAVVLARYRAPVTMPGGPGVVACAAGAVGTVATSSLPGPGKPVPRDGEHADVVT